jgi:hypothetical protein
MRNVGHREIGWNGTGKGSHVAETPFCTEFYFVDVYLKGVTGLGAVNGNRSRDDMRPSRCGFALWIAPSAFGTTNPLSGVGMISGPPDTHSICTVSPELILRTAGITASRIPKRVVSGEALS